MSGVGRELVIESASQATEASSMKESRARCTTHTHTHREREKKQATCVAFLLRMKRKEDNEE